MRFPGLKLFFLLALAVIFVGTIYAEIYKWIDAEGNVYYGDCPPADCKPEQIEAPPIPTEEDVQSATKRSQQLIQEQDARYQKQRVEREIAQQEEQQRRQEISKKCKTMRNRLILLQQQGVITIVDYEGNLLQPSDEVREQMITGIEAYIEENCQ